MENAADAIKMAGSVLLFVIALSIAVLTFSQAREAIDSILRFSDREAYTEDLEGNERNLFYYDGGQAEIERYVGLEAIVPTLYRAMKESYIVEFINSADDDIYLFEADDRENALASIPQPIYSIDDTKENYGNAAVDKEEFITSILYGKNANDNHFGNVKRRYTYTDKHPGSSLYQAIKAYLQGGRSY